jgi:hypothetical protein
MCQKQMILEQRRTGCHTLLSPQAQNDERRGAGKDCCGAEDEKGKGGEWMNATYTRDNYPSIDRRRIVRCNWLLGRPWSSDRGIFLRLLKIT